MLKVWIWLQKFTINIDKMKYNTITQKELQIIFDDNGLDSYCVYSIGLNHGANGDVIIDSDLIGYLGAFSCVVRHLY